VKTLNSYVIYLNKIFLDLNLFISIYHLPLKEKKITLLKSPHVFKKAKEQFKFSTYKCVITIKSDELNNYKSKLFLAFLNKPKTINVITKI
jgi:ribosomal protein S10